MPQSVVSTNYVKSRSAAVVCVWSPERIGSKVSIAVLCESRGAAHIVRMGL